MLHLQLLQAAEDSVVAEHLHQVGEAGRRQPERLLVRALCRRELLLELEILLLRLLELDLDLLEVLGLRVLVSADKHLR